MHACMYVHVYVCVFMYIYMYVQGGTKKILEIVKKKLFTIFIQV
jgi:hypothetical protein